MYSQNRTEAVPKGYTSPSDIGCVVNRNTESVF